MVMTKEEQKRLRELREILTGLSKIDPDSLDRTAELGTELGFKDAVPGFRRTLALFAELGDCNLEGVPAHTLQQLRDLAKQAWDALQAIQSFSISQNPSNPKGQRDGLVANINSQWQNWYANITPVIAYSKAIGADYSHFERQAQATLSSMKEQLAELKSQKDEGITEIRTALEQVRKTATEAGVTGHAFHFSTESKSYATQSKWWLVSAIAFAAATIVYALFGLGHELRDLGDDPSPGRVIQILASRIVVLSVLTFGLVWASRNYAACRHNLVVNRHRQNALSTFQTFAKAAADPQTKDAVLVQATNSIFSAQPSGFMKGESDAPGSHIVEIVRGMSGGKE